MHHKPSDPDLMLVVQRWPNLPENIKTTIKTLVDTASGKPSRTARKGKGEPKEILRMEQSEFKVELDW